MNIKAEVSFEISTGLPAVLYLVERRVGRSKFVRNLESQKTLKLGSFEFLCLVLLQVAKCFGLVQTFCARLKDELHSVKLVFVPAQKFLKSNFWADSKNLDGNE